MALRKNHVVRLGAFGELWVFAQGDKFFGAFRTIELSEQRLGECAKCVAPPFLLSAIPHSPTTFMSLRNESDFWLAHI